jgi:hypothetical protein
MNRESYTGVQMLITIFFYLNFSGFEKDGTFSGMAL